jgi:MFS family permease
MDKARGSAAALVAGCFLLCLTGRGLVESFTVFLLPISTEFGWERASVISIYSIAVLVNGLAAPFVGRILDFAGPRALFVGGLCLFGVCFSLAGHSTALWQFQLLVGLGGGSAASCLGNVPTAIMLGKWFRSRLTLATSIVFSAFGIGILLVLPFAQTLIDAFGWRTAYTVLGIIALALAIPTAIFPWTYFRIGRPLPPEESGAAARGALLGIGAALRHPTFWALSTVYFFTGVAMYAITVQIVAYLVDSGFKPIEAASAWGVSGLLLPVGMILVGWLDGVIGRRRSLLLSYGLSLTGIGCLWLLSIAPNIILLGAFLATYGSMLGSRAPLIATIAMNIFRGPNAATILGMVTVSGGLGSATGAWVGGFLHDLTGGYQAVLAFSACSILIAVFVFFTARDLRGG